MAQFELHPDMPLDMRWDFNQVKSAIKYIYVKGNPLAICFQKSLQICVQNNDEYFRSVFGKVREVLGNLPVAHMEIVKVVIPDYECGEIEVFTSLRDNIANKERFATLSYWHMGRNI